MEHRIGFGLPPEGPSEPLPGKVFTALPSEYRRPRRSAWSELNAAGRVLDSFLEGPSFDREGNLWVCDIPNGRIFRIDADGGWTLAAEYDGWPNGIKIHADGRLFIADHARGLLSLRPTARSPETLLPGLRNEQFRGLNDLHFAANGDLYFTDQGQTGLHDPSGRLFRLSASGELACLLDCCPSPNGLCLDLEERQLFLAVTRANAVWRVPLMPDGGVSKVGLYLQLSGSLAGPDGLALDVEGGLVVAHPGLTVWRFDARGRKTHHVETPHESFFTNVAFNGTTLYLVDSHRAEIVTVEMPFAGRTLFSRHDQP